ncbi:MAG: twin-arginine translocase TatA/TatE family subunit [Omnitrophica WOR_2 bacterium]
MDIGPAELIIILLIVILLFGVGRIGKVAGELGQGIRAFREGLKNPDEDEPKTSSEPKPQVKEVPATEEIQNAETKL